MVDKINKVEGQGQPGQRSGAQEGENMRVI